jgi:hypothetical protein
VFLSFFLIETTSQLAGLLLVVTLNRARESVRRV